MAQVAFLYVGDGVLPAVPRDLEGTGDHAVATADADVPIVDDRALGALLERADDAGLDARGLEAVPALPPQEAVPLIVLQTDDGRPAGAREVRDLVQPPPGPFRRELVDLLAGLDAFVAADALGHVCQDREVFLSHIGSFSLPRIRATC